MELGEELGDLFSKEKRMNQEATQSLAECSSPNLIRAYPKSRITTFYGNVE